MEKWKPYLPYGISALIVLLVLLVTVCPTCNITVFVCWFGPAVLTGIAGYIIGKRGRPRLSVTFSQEVDHDA